MISHVTCFQSNLQLEPTLELIKTRFIYAIDLTFLMVVLLVVLRPYGNASSLEQALRLDVRVSY